MIRRAALSSASPERLAWTPIATHRTEAKAFIAKPDLLRELNCHTPIRVSAQPDQSIRLHGLIVK